VSGVLSGAFGVGGAVISTPGIRLLGASALVAIGTTLPSIIPSAASGTARYARERIIDWHAVAWTVPLGIVAAIGGSLLSREIPGEGHLLQLLTAGLLGVTAIRMGRSAPPADDQTSGRGTPARYGAVGALAGLLSGLLGIGGGVVMVPGFHSVAGLPIKSAIATSLVCVGAFAVPGTVTHAVIGNVDWRFALLLTIGVVPGARIGASLALRAADHRLRFAVAVFLGAIAVVYAAGELAAL
jgi:uncharacterized protein